MHRIFVYGTLRQGGSNARLLADSEFLGRAITVEPYRLYDFGHYPAIIRGGQSFIYGEVYEVDGRTLRLVDRLEEHPDYYQRTEVEVQPFGTVWTYVFEESNAIPSDARLIASGDWMDGRRERT
jgi:gamma-glutamylcyclotransferase (GGCT)/AIG2-like uncharacterized protein YtfP